MKKLILPAVFILALSVWAAAQNTSQTSSKQSGPTTEEKTTQKNLKNGTIKKGNKKTTAESYDIKLPLPDHASYATDTTTLAPKPKEEK